GEEQVAVAAELIELVGIQLHARTLRRGQTGVLLPTRCARGTGEPGEASPWQLAALAARTGVPRCTSTALGWSTGRTCSAGRGKPLSLRQVGRAGPGPARRRDGGG